MAPVPHMRANHKWQTANGKLAYAISLRFASCILQFAISLNSVAQDNAPLADREEAAFRAAVDRIAESVHDRCDGEYPTKSLIEAGLGHYATPPPIYACLVTGVRYHIRPLCFGENQNYGLFGLGLVLPAAGGLTLPRAEARDGSPKRGNRTGP